MFYHFLQNKFFERSFLTCYLSLRKINYGTFCSTSVPHSLNILHLPHYIWQLAIIYAINILNTSFSRSQFCMCFILCMWELNRTTLNQLKLCLFLSVCRVRTEVRLSVIKSWYVCTLNLLLLQNFTFTESLLYLFNISSHFNGTSCEQNILIN